MAAGFREALANFKEYFKNDLTGYIASRKTKSNTDFKAVIAGGYGLQTLLETKLGLYGKVHTGDCDITITSFRTKQSLYDTYKYFIKKVAEFIHTQDNPQFFKVHIVDQANQYVQVMNYHKFAVIMIKFKGYDFVDIDFTDMKLTMDMIDKKNSLKAGLPLKTLESYLTELITMIYLENVSTVYPEAYYRRNPLVGTYKEKGIKDLQRAKLVCSLTRSKKYVKYCGIINRTSLRELATMTKEERDEYFKALSLLVVYRKRVTKHLTTPIDSM
jgi:hypothetical protein